MAAARKVAQSVDWKKIFDRTPPSMRSHIGAFKNKSDTIMSNYSKAQAAVTNIDWDHYMANVDNKGLVNDFKAKFEALEIPKPVDTKSSELVAKAEKDMQEYKDIVAKLEVKGEKVNAEIERLCSLPPFEQMTNADIYHHFPKLDHRTSNWGYTDMSGSDRRPFDLVAPPSNPPDVSAYLADLKAKKE